MHRLLRYLPHLLGIGIAAATVGLLTRVWFEVSSGVLHNDALIFQTVARGMLNGIPPYSGLFETKPPGVFLLHAASLALFGNQLLVKLLQAIALLAIPLLTVFPVLGIIEDKPAKERRELSLFAILFGLLLALYSANQAGEGLMESYGAPLAMGYLILSRSSSWNWKHMLSASALLLLAAGLREPFSVIILAGCVLLVPQPRDLLPRFVYPLAIACGIGFVALLVTGIAEPFFQVYLPHMLGFHVLQQDLPVYVRMFAVWRVFINMGAYSWFFAAAVSGLIAATFIRGNVIRDWLFVIRIVCALLLTLLAIAIGGDFYGHHFVFAVPVYAALLWFAITHGTFSLHRLVLPLLSVLMVLTALLSTQFDFRQAAATWEERETELRIIAEKVDTVMDKCGYEKFLQMIVRGWGPYSFMKHSPYGPIFVHYSRFIGGSQAYTSAHIKALQETPLVLLLDIEKSNLTDFAQQFIGARFSEDPPPCAGADYTPPEPYHLLFRQ